MSLPENPITRNEMYLSRMAGEGTQIPDHPITREEMYLDYIARHSGDAPVVDDVPTEDSDNLVKSGGVYSAEAALAESIGGVSSNVQEITGNIGDLSSLRTTDKSSLVAAINEAAGHGNVTLYAFHIDGSESDPSAKVTYLEDARGMTPAGMDYTNGKFSYGSWANAFFMPKPCMVKQSGGVDYYLDPNDYTKKADGTASDIASTSYAGNAMMEWGQNGKKIWYKVIPDDNDATSGTVYICDERIDEEYHAWSFINNQGDMVDHFYTPIYNGSVTNGVMRSLSGQAVSKSLAGGATGEINAAKGNNKDSNVCWFIETIADRILINFLLILMGKSVDTQTVFGRGLDTGSETALTAYVTGALNDKGLFFGYNNGTHGVKVFGMENWWAAQLRRTAGYILSDGDQKIKLTYGVQDGSAATEYNTDGTGYISMGITPTGTTGGYIDTMNFNQYGMFGKNSSGSSTTHYCDGQWYYNSGARFALCGGSSSNGANCGAFCTYLNCEAGFVSWNVGAALSYKPLSRRG